MKLSALSLLVALRPERPWLQGKGGATRTHLQVVLVELGCIHRGEAVHETGDLADEAMVEGELACKSGQPFMRCDDRKQMASVWPAA